MKKSKTQEFAARVAEASRSDLIVIMYDVILEDIKEAREVAALDRAEFKHLLQHASKFVRELMSSLNFEYKLSYELWPLYEYVNGKLTSASFTGDLKLLDEAEIVLPRMREAFAKVAEADTTGPIMANTQQITAGLTYGRGSLNEVTLNDSNRGYLA